MILLSREKLTCPQKNDSSVETMVGTFLNEARHIGLVSPRNKENSRRNQYGNAKVGLQNAE